MASNSITQCNSSHHQMMKKYDVFVSFRGKDTRNNFTDHLFAAFHRKGILAFRDETKLKKGERIISELHQAIEGSQILIVVLSKNYASSTWCLRELEKILDCVKVSGKRVLPIFYDVDPSEVRKQSGDYAKAFAKHEERFGEDKKKMMEVNRWREALTQVADISGWDIGNKSSQYAEIEKIVQEVISILGRNFSSLPSDLVGMESPIEELEKLLFLDPVDDVRVVGICGMGGIGKSTLATTLYDRISHQYDACCFIDDLSKIYRDGGPIGALKELLCQTLNEEYLQICNLYNAANLVRSRLRYVKTLIVLDNVDQDEQLEKIVVNREWLGAGSAIIIISRDQHILENYRANVYQVPLLSDANALKLFCKKAFNCDDIVRDYRELTHDVLKFANGLPLAIKVLGSFLFGRNVSEWRSALVRLKENPNNDILDVLQISYDGLQDLEKQIFLDIACFFSWYGEQYVKKVLDYCGFHSEIGIGVLVDKSLIDICDGSIIMHDLLRELGKKIVKGNSPKEPGRWSRLWLGEDFYNATSDAMETKNTEAVVLASGNAGGILMIDAEGLSKMSHLRLLMLFGVNFRGSLKYLSNKLHYLQWYQYPFSYLPLSFQPNKLVELNLIDSSIKQLWKGIKYLPNLRAMNLNGSKNLIGVPDFRGIPNLERLILVGCIKLVSVHPSVGLLSKLAHLNLENCKNLVCLPTSILGLSSLEYLNTSGCPKVYGNQLLDKPIVQKDHFKMLDIRETAMQSHSSSSSSFFKRLMLPFCSSYSRGYRDSAGYLLPSLPSFSCLYYLNLSFCNLSQIPVAIGCLHCLEYLNLGGNNFVSLPCSISKLSKLVYLNLEHCKQLRYLPRMPSPTAMPSRRGIYYFAPDEIGLFIFNCPNIVDIERCCGMAFEWLTQVVQVSQESSTPIGCNHRRIPIVIPASEIPRWFDNQSVGTSISLDPSPILHDHNNWIGIACSVVFIVPHDPNKNLNKPRENHICIRFGRETEYSGLCLPVLLREDLVTVELHHLWLLYLSREQFFSFSRTEKIFDLYSMQMKIWYWDGQGWHLNVIKCGYQWVFKKDLEQLIPTMKHRRCNNIHVDDDSVEGSSILPLDYEN